MPAFEGLKDRADALHVSANPLILSNVVRINILAVGARLPSELHFQGVRPGGRAPGLRTEFRAHLSTCRRFLRQVFSRDKTGRYPGRTANRNSTSLSVSQPRKRSAYKYRRRYSPAPTR